jgi:predicted NBD/HSP70 family sugar kinase
LPGGGPQAVAEVIEAAHHGDARSRAAVEEVAHWSGVGMRAVINLFNPEMIVLGGCLAQVWEAAGERVNDALERTTLISRRSDVTIRSGEFGMDAPLIGAAELAFAPLLQDPQSVAQPA